VTNSPSGLIFNPATKPQPELVTNLAGTGLDSPSLAIGAKLWSARSLLPLLLPASLLAGPIPQPASWLEIDPER